MFKRCQVFEQLPKSGVQTFEQLWQCGVQTLFKHCSNAVQDGRTSPTPQKAGKWLSGFHFQALKLSLSDLKYHYFLFSQFFFAKYASGSLKMSCRLDMSHWSRRYCRRRLRRRGQDLGTLGLPPLRGGQMALTDASLHLWSDEEAVQLSPFWGCQLVQHEQLDGYWLHHPIYISTGGGTGILTFCACGEKIFTSHFILRHFYIIFTFLHHFYMFLRM